MPRPQGARPRDTEGGANPVAVYLSDMDKKPEASAVPASRLARLTQLGTMTAGVAGNMALGGMAEISRGRRPAMRGSAVDAN